MDTCFEGTCWILMRPFLTPWSQHAIGQQWLLYRQPTLDTFGKKGAEPGMARLHPLVNVHKTLENQHF